MNNYVAIARSREFVHLRVIVLYIRATILCYAGNMDVNTPCMICKFCQSTARHSLLLCKIVWKSSWKLISSCMWPRSVLTFASNILNIDFSSASEQLYTSGEYKIYNTSIAHNNLDKFLSFCNVLFG